MVQTVCKEHEYIEVEFTVTGIEKPVKMWQCKNCGLPKYQEESKYVVYHKEVANTRKEISQFGLFFAGLVLGYCIGFFVVMYFFK